MQDAATKVAVREIMILLGTLFPAEESNCVIHADSIC